MRFEKGGHCNFFLLLALHYQERIVECVLRFLSFVYVVCKVRVQRLKANYVVDFANNFEATLVSVLFFLVVAFFYIEKDSCDCYNL